MKNYQSLFYKYKKFKTRLDKAIQNGSFNQYTYRKRLMLLKRLDRLRYQLGALEVSLKHAAAGAVFTVGMAVSSPTEAQTGDEFQVNTYTSTFQNNSSIAMDSDGDFVIAWQSKYQESISYGIYAQRYNASGEAQGDEFQVNTYTADLQGFPSIGMDSDGDFVIAWQSQYQEGNTSFGIYAQRYNASGEAQGDEFQVNTYTTGLQSSPSIGMDSDGDFVIVWESDGQDGSNSGIYAQRYDALGVRQGDEFQVNTHTSDTQSTPSIGMDSDGGFVITWQSNNQEGAGGISIYAQRYNASGVKQGDEFQVNTYTTSTQSTPSIGMDSDGDFVISWESYSQDGSKWGTYAQRYNASGEAQGDEFQVNTYTTDTQSISSIGMDSDGDFVIAWESDGQDGSDKGIYAQRYNASGEAQGDEFLVNTYTTNHQESPSIGMDSDGDFVIAWESLNQNHPGISVFAQRYTSPKAPVLSAIEDQSIEEGSELTFTASASDANGDDLSYSLDASSVSAGMSINSSTGAFSWTPTTSQSGSYEVTITVSDGYLSDPETVMFTVTDLAEAPVLSAIEDQSIEEGSELTFTASASDANGDDLSYSLDASSVSAGMSINSSTGAFSWTPTTSQSGSYEVTITVSDGSLSDTETVMITVTDLAEAPVLSAIEDQSIEEGSELTFTASASDANGDDLSYSLDASSVSAGMSINSSTGAFSWTPTTSQSGSYEVTITVSDGSLSDTETIMITVTDLAEAPVLSAIEDQSIEEDSELTFTASASDANGDDLSYSLDASSVSTGMSINSSTGAFSWTPTLEQSGSYEVTLSVSDGALSASETFTITVTDKTTLSISELESVQVSIYPNPTPDQLTVVFGLEVSRSSRYEIVGLQGAVLQSGVISGATAEIDVSDLSAGVYVLRLSGDDQVYSVQFIKE